MVAFRAAVSTFVHVKSLLDRGRPRGATGTDLTKPARPSDQKTSAQDLRDSDRPNPGLRAARPPFQADDKARTVTKRGGAAEAQPSTGLNMVRDPGVAPLLGPMSCDFLSLASVSVNCTTAACQPRRPNMCRLNPQAPPPPQPPHTSRWRV